MVSPISPGNSVSFCYLSMRHSHTQVNKREEGWFHVLMLLSVSSVYLCSSCLAHLVSMNALFSSRSVQSSMLTSTCRSVQLAPWRKASKGQLKFLVRSLTIKPHDCHDHKSFSAKITNLDLTSLQARRKLIVTATNNIIVRVFFFQTPEIHFLYYQLLLSQCTPIILTNIHPSQLSSMFLPPEQLNL